MATGTREALVQTAEGLMRTKGYAAFSYADLAATVGIRKASIHHHFPTKEDLGIAIVEEYIARVRLDFDRIELGHKDVYARMEAFAQLFRVGNEEGLLPLCGALAAEMSALPAGLQKLTQGFFDMQLSWLTAILDHGIARGELPKGGGSRHKAFVLLSLLEGASFVGWATNEGDRIDANVVRLIVEQA